MARDKSGASEYDVSLALDSLQLKRLKWAISSASAAARRELRGSMKEAGVIIQGEIKSRTPVYSRSGYGRGRRAKQTVAVVKGARGSKTSTLAVQRHSPGLLKKSTKLNIGRLSVAVYNDAKQRTRRYPGGYRYGKRLEFDPAFGDKYAFFYPGWSAAKAQARAVFDKVLEAAYDAFIKGG